MLVTCCISAILHGVGGRGLGRKWPWCSFPSSHCHRVTKPKGGHRFVQIAFSPAPPTPSPPPECLKSLDLFWKVSTVSTISQVAALRNFRGWGQVMLPRKRSLRKPSCEQASREERSRAPCLGRAEILAHALHLHLGLFPEGFVLTQQVAWMTQLFSSSPLGFYISMLVTA